MFDFLPVARIGSAVTWFRSKIAKWRTPIGLSALVFVLCGTVWSFAQLNIAITDLDLRYWLILAVVISPLSLAYGAVGMLLAGRSAGTSMSFGTAWKINNYAQLAEALPLPGGAIVRTAGLVQAGVNTGRSAALVLAGAALWIALAASGAGLELAMRDHPAGAVIAVIGMFASLASVGWLWRMAGPVNTGLTIMHRLFGLVLTTIRLQCAFAVVAVSLGLLDALPFAFAMIAGSAASIAPAGLGISEGLAALVAPQMAMAPAAAFLAVAVNRLTGIAVSAALTLPDHFEKPRHNGAKA